MESGRREGSSRRNRLFFYLTALIMALAVSIMALSGCGEQGGTAQSEGVSRVVFEPNNGEGEIIRYAGEDIPEPRWEGYEFAGWYRDKDLEERETGETVLEIIAGNGRAEEIRLYGKWKREQEGVRMEDAFFIYDGKTHGLEITGLAEGSEVEYIGEMGYTDAGEYEIVAIVKCEGYKDTEIRGKLEIGRAKIDESKIKFEGKTEIWDGEEKRLEIEGELPEGVTAVYENNGHTEAGEYEVRVRFEVGKNYEEIEERVAILKIEELRHAVKLIEEDGSYVILEVVHGKMIEDLPTPKAKRGYRGKWDKEIGEITEDVELKAEYEIEEYGIKYELNGGDISGDALDRYTVEEEVNLPAATRIHYEFLGWYIEGKRVEKIERGSIGDKEITAEWKAEEYRVEYELRGGINDVENTPDGDVYIYTVESVRKELKSAKRRGYRFIGWKDEAGEIVTEIDGAYARDIKLYAEWELEEYEIRYETRGGINSAGAIEKYTVESAGIELQGAVKRGYEFGGWYEDAECAGERKAVISEEDARDITLYAKWEKKEYKIVYELDGGENDIANPEVYDIESGILSLESAKRRGYEFKGWYLENGERVREIDADKCEDIVLYAKWEILRYEVRYELNGGENGEGNPREITVESGEIYLEAGRREGYEFCGWYDNAGYAGEAVEKIDGRNCEDITLYAKWEKREEPAPPVEEESEYEVEEINGKWTVTGYDYGRGTEVVIPIEIDGRKVEGIASGVLISATAVKIEAEISELKAEVFAGCRGIKRIEIGSGVKEISEGALKDCEEIEVLTVPYAGRREMGDEDGVYEPLAVIFGTEERESAYGVTVRPMQVVNGERDVYYDDMPTRYVPKSLKKVRITGSVQGYGLYGFKGLEEIEVGGAEIGICGLRECEGLRVLTIMSVSTLAGTALRGCAALETVYVGAQADCDLIQSVLSANKLNADVVLI